MKSKLLFLFIAFVGFALTGCGDPVQGCTDPDAENYNSEAEESDGSCTYERDKFLGNYSGEIMCGFPVSDGGTFDMEVNEGLSASDQVELVFSNTELPLPTVQATVVGDSIFLIDKEVNDVEISGFVFDVLVGGEGAYQANMSISGIMTLGLLNEDGEVEATSECEFTANKN